MNEPSDASMAVLAEGLQAYSGYMSPDGLDIHMNITSLLNTHGVTPKFSDEGIFQSCLDKLRLQSTLERYRTGRGGGGWNIYSKKYPIQAQLTKRESDMIAIKIRDNPNRYCSTDGFFGNIVKQNSTNRRVKTTNKFRDLL